MSGRRSARPCVRVVSRQHRRISSRQHPRRLRALERKFDVRFDGSRGMRIARRPWRRSRCFTTGAMRTAEVRRRLPHRRPAFHEDASARALNSGWLRMCPADAEWLPPPSYAASTRAASTSISTATMRRYAAQSVGLAVMALDQGRHQRRCHRVRHALGRRIVEVAVGTPCQRAATR